MEAPREDPGMSLGFFGQHGGLCVWGQLGRILGCPWDPPDGLEGCVLGEIQGGSWDTLGIPQTAWRAGCGGTSREVLGILQSAWRAVCVRTSRDDPVMSSK